MVQFNPETRQIGLDGDEEQMVAYGFAGGPLLRSPRREFFLDTRRARDIADDNKSEHDRNRDGDILWINIGDDSILTQDVFDAIKQYISGSLNKHYLECEPPFDTNALLYQNALLAREKAAKAIFDLSIIDAQLKITDAEGGNSPYSGGCS